MKKLIIALVCLSGLLLCLSSCSTYYYSTLRSNDRVGQYNADKDFVVENDSVCITYCFYGEDAPVQITIFNKLDEPLFVDWQRSALIVDDVATSYYRDVASMEGRTESTTYSGSTYNWNGHYGSVSGSSSGSFRGEIKMPKGADFIPPKSQIQSPVIEVLKLKKPQYSRIPDRDFEEQGFIKKDGSRIVLKVMDFTERNSPLRFRSYLSLFTGAEAPEYFTFECSFYLSNLVRAGNITPPHFEAGQYQDGNFFYSCDSRGKRTGWIIGGTALVVGALAIPFIFVSSQPGLNASF